MGAGDFLKTHRHSYPPFVDLLRPVDFRRYCSSQTLSITSILVVPKSEVALRHTVREPARLHNTAFVSSTSLNEDHSRAHEQ